MTTTQSTAAAAKRVAKTTAASAKTAAASAKRVAKTTAASVKTTATSAKTTATSAKTTAKTVAVGEQTAQIGHVRCQICAYRAHGGLRPHLEAQHGLSVQAYLALYPEASVHPEAPEEALNTAQSLAQARSTGYVRLQAVTFPYNPDVPEAACLPLPDAYRFPVHGALASDVRHALLSIKNKRSVFIHGLPGSGKDALPHAVSALTRTPGLIRSIKPGVDIQSWFYSRSFDRDGTTWETGPLFRALTQGYEVRDAQGALVRRVPYLIVISDFDRADRAQAEHLRLIMDSIQGRVEGPQGETYPVLPGTVIIATGNSAGSGDQRGRCISSNVIDASLLDRFDRVYEFHWMEWADEEPILRRKFPQLKGPYEELLEITGRCTEVLRGAIQREALYAEFSHRAVCAILGHAQDILDERDHERTTGQLFRSAIRAWLDRVGDPITREEALKLMDPHVPAGMLAHDQGPRQKKVNW